MLARPCGPLLCPAVDARGEGTLAMSQDAPVARLDLWLAMAAAVHRSADDRAAWDPAESLTAAESLAAGTPARPPWPPRQPRRRRPPRRRPAPADGRLRRRGLSCAPVHLRERNLAATLLAGRATHFTI